MRVMVFAKATGDGEQGAAPTAEALEAFAAMDARADACDGKH